MVHFQNCMINGFILCSPFINTFSHYSLLSQDSLSVVDVVVATVAVVAVWSCNVLHLVWAFFFFTILSPFSAFKLIQLKFQHCSSFLVWSSSTGKVITHGNCVGWRGSRKKKKINWEMSKTFFLHLKNSHYIWAISNIITLPYTHTTHLCNCK